MASTTQNCYVEDCQEVLRICKGATTAWCGRAQGWYKTKKDNHYYCPPCSVGWTDDMALYHGTEVAWKNVDPVCKEKRPGTVLWKHKTVTQGVATPSSAQTMPSPPPPPPALASSSAALAASSSAALAASSSAALAASSSAAMQRDIEVIKAAIVMLQRDVTEILRLLRPNSTTEQE